MLKEIYEHDVAAALAPCFSLASGGLGILWYAPT